MTTHQRQQAIWNVQERIDVLLALHADSDDALAQRYKAKLAENIVDAVIALTSESTPEDLECQARSMREAWDRGRRLRKAGTHL